MLVILRQSVVAKQRVRVLDRVRLVEERVGVLQVLLGAHLFSLRPVHEDAREPAVVPGHVEIAHETADALAEGRHLQRILRVRHEDGGVFPIADHVQ